jgi:hypothetical protein
MKEFTCKRRLALFVGLIGLFGGLVAPLIKAEISTQRNLDSTNSVARKIDTNYYSNSSLPFEGDFRGADKLNLPFDPSENFFSSLKNENENQTEQRFRLFYSATITEMLLPQQVFFVTNTNDSGAGTLRQAIIDANANPGADTISFNIPGTGPHKIQPLTPLPHFTDPARVDGYTQPGSQPNQLPGANNAVIQIQIDGNLMPRHPQGHTDGYGGLTFVASASTAAEKSSVKGISLTGFNYGIYSAADGFSLTGSFVGIEPDGSTVRPNIFYGVYIQANDNRIGTDGDGANDYAERNILSGNDISNVYVSFVYFGSTIVPKSGTVIAGNLIGTDRTGTIAKPSNTGEATPDNPSVQPCNIGIWLNVAPQTRIGTNGDGTADAAEQNVISGNTGTRVTNRCSIHDGRQGINAWFSHEIIVAGNLIGTDVTGTRAVPNLVGVNLHFSDGGRVGTNSNGTSDVEERNIISGNLYGVQVLGTTNDGTRIMGNYIGTDITATQAIPNYHGITTGFGANNTRIGSTNPSDRNIISGNSTNGVDFHANNGSQVINNYIGTDVSGAVALPNDGTGVFMNADANNISGNLISGNKGNGVVILSGQGSNVVQGNKIGVDVTGTTALPNLYEGVYILGADNNQIGGSTAAQRNIISANRGNGVRVETYYCCGGYPDPANGNQIEGNMIGTDAGSTLPLGNGGYGVQISQAYTTTVRRNVIVLNQESGMLINQASNNTVSGNYIGTTPARTPGFGNLKHGIYFYHGATSNIIGGTSAGGGNVIANNADAGIYLGMDGQSNGNSFLGNSIYSNGQLGIDLAPYQFGGVTPNDDTSNPYDADDGPNRLQNYPMPASAGNWTLRSTPNTLFRIEFFGNATADPSTFGEGEKYLGFVNVTTDASGNAAISAAPYDAAYPYVSATATDPEGNTSEFGKVQLGTPPPTPTPTPTASPTPTVTPTPTPSPGNCPPVSVTVPGSSNPFLAGMPEGSTDHGWDSVPAQSPVLVSGISITPGARYSFSATGAVHLGDGNAAPPDGFAWYNNAHYASNGIGGYTAGPANALLGVFLSDSAPNTTAAPDSVDLYAGANSLTTSPALKQIFFIGDGKTGNGATQSFVAPPGATRLFLATQDGFGWFNNGGSFNVTVTENNCGGQCTPTNNSLFTDTFDSENDGTNGFRIYQDFEKWDVTEGSVDLLGGNYGNLQPGNGLYVDLDGSTNSAGTMETKQTFALAPGTYQLSFELAGNRRGPQTDVVTVKLGDVYSEDFSLPFNAPFRLYTRTISVTAATSGKISFAHSGGDFVGMLLDDVKLVQTQSCPGVTPQPIVDGLPSGGGVFGPGTPGQPGSVTKPIGGTGIPGALIRITVTDPTHPQNNFVSEVTVDADGKWSLDLTLYDCHPEIEIVQVYNGVSSERIRRQIYVDSKPPVFTTGGPIDGTDIIENGGSSITVTLEGSATDEGTEVPGAGVSYIWTLIGGGAGGTDLILGEGGIGTLIDVGEGIGSGLEIDLQTGEYEFELKVLDVAGNYIIKRCRRIVRTRPQPPIILIGLPEDGGIYGPGTPGIPGKVTRRISGTGTPNCNILITISDPEHPASTNNNRTLTVPVDANGNWSVDLTLDDCHPFVEIAQDCDGIKSLVNRRRIYVDGTPPRFINGGPGDGVNYITGGGTTARVVLSGSAEDITDVPGGGVTYKWYRIGAGGVRVELGTGGAGGILTNGGAGLEIDLQAGSYDFEVEVCDTAGNCVVKRCRRTVLLPLTLTGGLPGNNGIMGPGTGYTVVSPGVVRTRLTGTGNPNCIIEVKISDPTHPGSTRNNRTVQVEVDSSGNWSLEIELDDCHPVIEIKQICPGSTGEVIRRQVYVDSTPPLIGLGNGAIRVGSGGTGAINLVAGASDPDSHVPNNVLTYKWYEIINGNRQQLACPNNVCPSTYTIAKPIGKYFFEVEVTDSAGNRSIKRCRWIVYGFPSGNGTFVIGNQNAVLGNQVMFWGAQWHQNNTMTGGSAPSAFKGYFNQSNQFAPTCGSLWTTDPGNSPPPPATIPQFMGIVASSSITKNGSIISGDVNKVVIVETNSGYSSNPGHAGTGTIVEIICP